MVPLTEHPVYTLFNFFDIFFRFALKFLEVPLKLFLNFIWHLFFQIFFNFLSVPSILFKYCWTFLHSLEPKNISFHFPCILTIRSEGKAPLTSKRDCASQFCRGSALFCRKFLIETYVSFFVNPTFINSFLFLIQSVTWLDNLLHKFVTL